MRAKCVALVGMMVCCAAATADVTYDSTITAGLQFPGRLAAASGGGFYVTEPPNGVVLAFDAGGVLAGTYAVPEVPVGIGVDLASGAIYVSRRDGAVGVYDAGFAPQGTLDPTPFAFVAPNDIAVHATTGEVYVVDSGAHQVLVFAGGTLVRAWGLEGAGLAEFRSPQALALDPVMDRVVVADLDNFRIQVFDTMGVFQFKFGYRALYLPDSEATWVARTEGVAVDACSNIYVADALVGTVRVFDAMGHELDADHMPVIGYGAGPGLLESPCDLEIFDDKLYVADTNGAAIEVYSVTCGSPLVGASLARAADRAATGRSGGTGGVGRGGRPAARPVEPARPDSPLEVIDAILQQTYAQALDLNGDRRVDLRDLRSAVARFGGGGEIDDFFDLYQERSSYDPPHVIDIAQKCSRCHTMDDLPGGMLSVGGQENLCLSCHSASKLALDSPIARAAQGNSHPWGVAADAGDVAGPGEDSPLLYHLDGGLIRCGTCHNPHELLGGGYLRNPNPNGALCKDCHRGVGAPIDHAVGLEHGPEYCTDCHDMHALGENLALVMERMYSWYSGGMVDVKFTDDTIGVGAGGFVDPAAGQFGLCDVCHPYFDDGEDPPVVSAEFLALSPSHDENMPACTNCHAHAEGFGPGPFSSALHFTRIGKATLYAEVNGGFEILTGIPMSDLPCQQCHATTYADGTPVDDATYEPSCRDCHADPANPGAVADAICYGCHSRQGAEGGIGLPDVHRDAGFTCMDCHTYADMHGDGTPYVSMLEPGAIHVECEDCHEELPDGIAAHDLHLAKVDCSACHTQSVISCYNCHFESMVDSGAKKFFGPPPRSGFKFLVNREGKVHTASFQSATYQGESFYVIAPYTAHAVVREVACDSCHGSAAVQEYDATGQIVVAEWDHDAGTLIGPTGVIPIPPDWSTSLVFDFLDYDPGTQAWSYLETGADLTQMMYATPLTPEQMAKLSNPYATSLHYTRAGKATLYAEENGGFEGLTGIPMTDLPCQQCHAPTYADGTPVDEATYVPSCRDCHADPNDPEPVADAVCYGCHSRQGAEGGIGLPDVHRDAGFGCGDCHTLEDMHGDGTPYVSMLEPGAIHVACEDCHDDLPPGISAHNIHADSVTCSACHTQSVISCYNCHFESMVDTGAKKFFGPPPRSGFKFLVRRDGKVHTASFQSATYQGDSFYVIAPYTAHAVVREVACDSCHASAAVQEYDATGQIVVAEWDESGQTLIGPTGVIPIPPDWQTALVFDFLDYDPGTQTWSYLETGADLTQMSYAEPLTEQQMMKLSIPH